ncbi:hypothetical protein HMPREF0742_02212 [Rothia aeria F0184]|uniref:Uncharacterized protein n=1 Tax=Rothia aeria F0184 TaxID=888019 RepID=U7UZT8_9MICC|nr:hypothetical protein [Rothia aeria]ERT64424.1 hypothetical protein HMPREF0742_02212 [Rothia aeria F0184]
MNTVVSYIVWLILIVVIVAWIYNRFLNSPQNLQEFVKYYSNVEWDIDYDYEKVLEGLEDYINSQSYRSGQVVSTKNYFRDEDGRYIDKKYVNKVTIDLMGRMYDKNGYECLIFHGPSDETGEISNSFYRDKSPLYNISFTERYYEDMNKKSSYNQNIVNSTVTVGVLSQGGKDNSFNNINISAEKDSTFIEYLNNQMRNIENKRDRRVLEDVLDILESGNYPSENDIEEISSDIKKRPLALQILKQGALNFSGQLGSEASKWFFDWIDSYTTGG